MTQIQLIQTTRFQPHAARDARPAADMASAEFDRMRRSQMLRQLVIALVFAFIAADVAIALDSLARL